MKHERWLLPSELIHLNQKPFNQRLGGRGAAAQHYEPPPPAWIDAPTNLESLSLSELREKANAERGAE